MPADSARYKRESPDATVVTIKTGIRISRDVLRSLTPQIIWRMARRLKSHLVGPNASTFEGPFSSWEAAASRSDGWDSPVITAKTFDAALKVKAGLIEFEQDGVARERIIYSETILAFLLLVLARHKDVVNIIDFGGGLGCGYFQNRKILRQLAGTSIRWNIVERPVLAKLGAEHFQSAELNFYSTLEDVFSEITPIPDAVLFSGSLQYVAEPLLVLDQAVNAGISIIALDRLLVWPRNKDAVFIQHPNPHTHYEATYPVRCFSRDALVAQFVARGFMLLERFSRVPDGPFDHCGLIFVRRT
jgi:putative methyltransferase (TIGR04325 family)